MKGDFHIMTRHVLPLFIAISVIAILTIPSWAGDNSSGALSARISLDSIATVNNTNTTLEPGEYKVVAEQNQAKFDKDGKVVAEVPCTLKTLPGKAAHTEFVVDQGRLLEIQVSGKTEAIEFSSGS
jgi:hypothetical protein